MKPQMTAQAPSAERIAEAILFSAKSPVTMRDLADALPLGVEATAVIAKLQSDYEGRGVRLVNIGGGWCFRTAPESSRLAALAVRPPIRLTKATMETLSVIAYFQPITRSEIERVRGVTLGSGLIDVLFMAGLIKPGRRRDTPGRPMTWVTTQEFLSSFDLPSIEELPEIARLREEGIIDLRAAIITGPEVEADIEGV